MEKVIIIVEFFKGILFLLFFSNSILKQLDFIIILCICFISKQSVPPVMAFHLGSLGFLTPFEFDNFEEQVTNVLEGNHIFIVIHPFSLLLLFKSVMNEYYLYIVFFRIA